MTFGIQLTYPKHNMIQGQNKGPTDIKTAFYFNLVLELGNDQLYKSNDDIFPFTSLITDVLEKQCEQHSPMIIKLYIGREILVKIYP